MSRALYLPQRDDRYSVHVPVHATAQQGFCLHCHRVVAIDEDKTQIYVAVAEHLETDHDISAVPIWIGKDFLLEPAPWRCDLCGVFVELPAWTYYTDPEWSKDPEWLVDDECAELIEAGREFDLAKRVLRVQLATNVTTRAIVQQTTFPILRQFLDQRTKPPTRIVHV